MTGAATKSALSAAVWLIIAVIAVNLIAILSPSSLLVRSVARSYVMDHDIMYDVSQQGSVGRDGKEVHRERVCVYWGGGAYVRPSFIDVDEKCPLFWAK